MRIGGRVAISALLSLNVPACGSSRSDNSVPSKEAMRVHTEYDFLLANSSTHELYAAHVNDGPEQVARARSALHEDSRVQVRRNAIVALSAALKDNGVPDYLSALDDQAPAVIAEAAASLTTYAAETTGRPKNLELIGKLREHAAALRKVFTSPDATARYNAACALNLIEDPEVDLATVLADPVAIVRNEGLGIAASRKLGPAEVKVLDALAQKDTEPQLRARAVTIVVLRAAPDLAAPVLAAALARGDVDRQTADAAGDQRLVAALPAMLAYLRAHPYDLAWLTAVKSFKAPCSARALAALLANNMTGSEALAALRALSGKPDWSAEQLAAWAQAQPEDIVPCATPRAP